MDSILKTIETIFSYVLDFALGFVAFIALLFILAILFGKRVIKKWEFEANFYNDKGKEIGEFDIEMKKYAKEESDFSLEAKLRLKHADLLMGKVVQVFLDDVLVMEGTVEKEGKIWLKNEHLKSDINDPHEGQICRVLCSSVELFSEKLIKD